jgi:hypothetical protein
MQLTRGGREGGCFQPHPQVVLNTQIYMPTIQMTSPHHLAQWQSVQSVPLLPEVVLGSPIMQDPPASGRPYTPARL